MGIDLLGIGIGLLLGTLVGMVIFMRQSMRVLRKNTKLKLEAEQLVKEAKKALETAETLNKEFKELLAREEQRRLDKAEIL